MAKLIKINGYKGDVLYLTEAAAIITLADIRNAKTEAGEKEAEAKEKNVKTFVKYRVSADSTGNIASSDDIETILKQL
jgi:hypothetical protein